MLQKSGRLANRDIGAEATLLEKETAYGDALDRGAEGAPQASPV